MKGQRWALWIILPVAALLVACQPAMVQPQTPPTMPSPPATSTPPPCLPTGRHSHTPTPPSSHTPTPTSTPTPAWPPPLTLPYTPTGDGDTGRIRGRLFFPSEYVPPLAVYAVATDSSRFYRVDTEPVPPGEPSYEIPAVEPGTYYVYSYPARAKAPFGGGYSYLAACEAGHFPPPPEGCWENPQQDLVPVEVRAGQAVGEINIFDWYSPSLPPPPDATGN